MCVFGCSLGASVRRAVSCWTSLFSRCELRGPQGPTHRTWIPTTLQKPRAKGIRIVLPGNLIGMFSPAWTNSFPNAFCADFSHCVGGQRWKRKYGVHERRGDQTRRRNWCHQSRSRTNSTISGVRCTMGFQLNRECVLFSYLRQQCRPFPSLVPKPGWIECSKP